MAEPREHPSTLKPVVASSSARRDGVALTIALHPDLSRVGERALLGERAITISRLEPVFAGPAGGTPRALEDPYLSRKALVLERREGGARIANPEGVAAQVDGVALRGALELEGLARGAVIGLGERVVLVLHRVALGRPPADHGLIGASAALDEVRRQIERVADLDLHVLVRGETGVGKELVARALHAASRRADGPFVALNMAALLASTAPSELFGHARGAFTGADRDHRGVFVTAGGGTLFLDEIGETPAEVQPMLLRALETGEVRPVGGSSTLRASPRVVAATDADLDAACEAGRFRAPLLHRLAGYELRIPALRERRVDVAPLFLHFLRGALTRMGEVARLDGSSAGSLDGGRFVELLLYAWPGNVRQLRAAAQRVAIASRGAPGLRLDALKDVLVSAPVTPPPSRPSELSEDALVATLEAHQWRPGPTARALGLPRSTLYDLIDRSPAVRKASEVPREELEAALADCDGDLTEAAARLRVSARGLRLALTSQARGAEPSRGRQGP